MPVLVCLLVYFASVSAAVQADYTPNKAAEPQTSSMDWLAGRWCMSTATRFTEEYWLPEAGGQLLGMSRTQKDGQEQSIDFTYQACNP